ncbi:MAG: hypothetical protein DAHOPDDO_02519 [Ignavibacteriaceae bacterium]|jgi:hypothetical protein|nr:hypothetical protein [Ignavibacteriaceae bacterium]MEB2297592.1 T9SS type A sorting domain-containing protein [Ignavibacteria bacterium]GIK60854.1 MAG: hypothetical protein BroJett017_17440 [Ignavibacteriota bacterium]GJQ43660.1 MAG: hypothetical protein JETCAE03_31580 [Ignavibacteriaceae bacterium]
MKNIFLNIAILLNIVIGSTIENYAHEQRTHQYIVREAYALLTQYLRRNIPIMQAALGFNEDGGFVSHWPGENGNPWIEGKIVAGAFREDEEDVMYGYGDGIGDLSRMAWASITHFWNADYGDEYLSHLNAPFDGYYPNALMKLRKYVSGDWEIKNYLALVWGLPNGNGVPCATQWANLHLTYNSLSDMYQNKKIYVTAVEFFGSGTVYYNPPRLLTNTNLQNISVEYLANTLTWEILGRMCHLLADMSVPAHVHCDVHWPDTDPYENAMAYGTLATYWNATRVWNIFGNIMDPLNKPDPLRYLMYDQNQYADHFGSRDFSGDDVISPPPYMIPYYPYNIQPTNLTGATLTETEKINIRDNTFPHVIRATAGLLYWFANEVGIIPPPPPPLSVTISGPTNAQKYTTSNFTSTVVGSWGSVTYQWEQMYPCCGDDLGNCGTYLIRGNGSTLTLYNNSAFHYYLKLTVWNGNQSVVDYHHVTVETCAPGGGGGSCPTLAYDVSGEITDDNPLLIKSPSNPGLDVTDYYLAQNVITPIGNQINLRVHEPQTEHTWLDYAELIVTRVRRDELVAVNDDGEIINYKESTAPVSVMLNGETDITDILTSMDSIDISLVEGDVLTVMRNSLTPEDEDDEDVVLGGEVPIKDQESITLKVAKQKDGDESLDSKDSDNPPFGGLFFRPNRSVIAKSLRNVPPGNLEIEINRDLVLDYLAIVINIRTARTRTLNLIGAIHNQQGNVNNLLGSIDQNYAEILPGESIDFTFQFDNVPTERIAYVIKTVGRYETDTTFAFNKLTSTDEEVLIPKENKLFDNYPNPFNPTTQIKYSVKENGLVTLKVYDVLGKEVAVLVNEDKLVGEYTVTFEAENLSSGIYFYTLVAKEFQQTKKMILVK